MPHCCLHRSLAEVSSQSWAVGNTQQVAFIYFKGVVFERGALGNLAWLVTSLGLCSCRPGAGGHNTQLCPQEQPGQQGWAQIPAFPTWKKKKNNSQGVNAKPAIPGDHPRAAARPGLRAMGLGGSFVWEIALKISCVALAPPPSGAAKGWASDCFLISEMSLSHE